MTQSVDSTVITPAKSDPENGRTTGRIHHGGDFHWVGDGFPVKSVFGYNDLGQQLSPFLLLDHAAPYNFPPLTSHTQTRRGVEAHPHRGFETVTIVFQGELEHRDSSGGGGKIGPGDVQWMTAASGLVHEEFHSSAFTNSGGMFEVVQLWVNLPAKNKSAQPAYQTILRDSIPTVTLRKDQKNNESESIGQLRVIAGEYRGENGTVSGPARTFTPIFLWDLQLSARASLKLPLPSGYTKAVLVLTGEIQGAKAGELLIFDRAQVDPVITASTDATALILSGEPINEPIVGYGPFVMNTEQEIKQAFLDYKMGRLGAL